LGIAGFLAFRDLTVEAFPDPTDTQVQVITLLPAAILTLLVLPVSLYWMVRAKAMLRERAAQRLARSTG
jgi:hypothetical protein